jgi:hypothetical protein
MGAASETIDPAMMAIEAAMMGGVQPNAWEQASFTGVSYLPPMNNTTTYNAAMLTGNK